MGSRIPGLQSYGGYVGASVSGTFLCIIGVLNLIVLLDILRIFREHAARRYDRERLEQRLLDRGLMNRFFVGRLAARIDSSWHMYPLGVLFGLGFDTATEVALLAISAGVATHHVPFLAVISLPLLFAAGMSLMDTADGAFMSQAYGWAFSNPVRQGLLQHHRHEPLGRGGAVDRHDRAAPGASDEAQLDTGFWRFLDQLDFGLIGYAIVALFVVAWAASALVWRMRRIERRWSALVD